MNQLKSVSLFFTVGAVVFLLGFLSGILLMTKWKQVILDRSPQDSLLLNHNSLEVQLDEEKSVEEYTDESASVQFAGFLDAASLSGVLGADTEYVVIEKDILRGTEVETTLKLPNKYVGMDRERFLKAMDTYEASPPLSELERGFKGLEVLSFSREKVVVEMDYRYVQPGECFYLALVDHQVVVYLEDQKTVYINTEISANMLSEELRQEMATGMIYVKDESMLYDFLEAYSS